MRNILLMRIMPPEHVRLVDNEIFLEDTWLIICIKHITSIGVFCGSTYIPMVYIYCKNCPFSISLLHNNRAHEII